MPTALSMCNHVREKRTCPRTIRHFLRFPDNFNTSMKLDTLLSVEAHTNLTNYAVPSRLTMSRIMYTSQSLNGTVVTGSAYVLWPYVPFEYTTKCGPQTLAKFPLMASAHGTAGQFQTCVPTSAPRRTKAGHTVSQLQLFSSGGIGLTPRGIVEEPPRG